MRRVFVFRDGKVLPKEEAGPHPLAAKRSIAVMRDLEPFVSPVDGTVIGSRTDRRAHNKRHGVIDVGNDPAVLRPKPAYEPKGIAEDIKRAIEVHGG